MNTFAVTSVILKIVLGVVGDVELDTEVKYVGEIFVRALE